MSANISMICKKNGHDSFRLNNEKYFSFLAAGKIFFYMAVIAAGMALVFTFLNPSYAAAAPEISFDGVGAVIGSYHFNNDGSHAWRTYNSRYNEYNPGITAFFRIRNIPVIDEAAVTYISKNSFGVPSLYISAYHKLASLGPLEFDLAAAIATGYGGKVEIADRLGSILPIAGITLIIFRHAEVDIIPAGYIAGNNTANELFFSLRFTGL